MAAQILEFRFDEGLWRLDWLGRISLPSRASEPQIAVYLSKLNASYEDALSNDSLAQPGRTEVAQVKVGQLPLLRIGSTWQDGIQQIPNRPAKELTITVSHQQFELIRFAGQVPTESGPIDLLPANRYRIGGRASREVSDSWLAVAQNPSPKLQFLAIPSTVLFQRCMGTSPKAIRQLILGKLDKIVDPASRYLDSAPITYYLNLFRDFTDDEAPFLANLAADPVANAEYRCLRHNLAKAASDFDKAKLESELQTHLKLRLPFSTPVKMRVRGKYLHTENLVEHRQKRWGFLVTEILDLEVRLAFDRLVIDRKNSGLQGPNAGDKDLPPAYGGSSSSSTETTEPFQPLTSAGDPARNLDALSLAACGGMIAVDLDVVKDEKLVQEYRASIPSEAGQNSGVGTTGEPSGTTSALAEVEIESSPIGTTPVTLEQFLKVLDALTEKDFRFESLPVANVHRRVGHHVVNYLPRLINGVRSWHLTSDADNAPARGYVVAELNRHGTWHYLIELERKGTGAFALAHIRHHEGLRIDRQSLQWFMIDVAKANGWNAIQDYRRWVYQPIRHTPSRGTEPFVQSILSKL